MEDYLIEKYLKESKLTNKIQSNMKNFLNGLKTSLKNIKDDPYNKKNTFKLLKKLDEIDNDWNSLWNKIEEVVKEII